MTLQLVQDDGPARDRIRGSLDESLLVEAAAGTGKTTMLVRRLVEVLATGRARIDGIVAVTFTRKAAGELKLRLRQELDTTLGETADPERRACLQRAIARLEEALIGTIHSFCAEVLRQRPVEAGVDPDFEEIDEEESARLYDAAFRSWVERRLEEMPEGLSRALSRLAASPSWDGAGPIDRLRDAGRSLLDWRDYPERWSRREFERDVEIDRLLVRVGEMAEIHRGNTDARDPLRQALDPAEQLDTWVRRSEEVTDERDYDALEARFVETLRALRRQAKKTGRGSWPVDGLSRAEVARRRDALIEELGAFVEAADADLAALLQVELGEVVQEYEELKRRNGQLDFLDLLLRARDLIREDGAVRRHLQGEFSHVFVDEFQDTDPLQAELLLLLAADDPHEQDWREATPTPGKLFVVGDPKQSIYRFRRADVVLYEDIKERLRARGVAVIQLNRSYRSTLPLQATVNAAFAPEMTGDRAAGQPAYVAMAPNDRETPADQPAVVALPVPRPYGSWGITKWQVEKGLPEAVGAWVQWLVEESGWTVEDPERRGERVPIRPRHVAILFRRFLSWQSDVTRPYLAALEARGVPHLLSGGRSFHQREEVETVRAALTAIEWPDDELSVFATLKGGLFAIPDDVLFRFRSQIGSLHPFRRLDPEWLEDAEIRPVAEALALLARLHRRRNRVPIAQTLTDLLEETRAHAAFAMRPAGNQVLANVQRVGDLARSFELRGGLSFRGFVQRLTDEAERPGSTEAPVLEEGAEGVRILTVHGAKGLEFPVVILADITANLAHARPGTYIDPDRRLCATRLLGCAPWELVDNTEAELARDRAEGVRVAYVAATRARDLLVVPTIGDGPWDDGWASPLNRALYPARERYRRSAPAPGCPEFGEASVLERANPGPVDVETSVRPGLHRSEAGADVVWWDPRLIADEVVRDFGVRQEQLLQPDPAGEAVSSGVEAHARWRQRRAAALEAGSRPTRTLLVVSEAEEPPSDYETEVRVEALERAADRPSGRRFGTLVHTLLRDCALDESEAGLQGLARLHGRMLGASEAEESAAVDAVARVLAHPFMARVREADEVLREEPVAVRLPDGVLLEGAVDLAFRESDRWFVVDFKTDAAVESLADRYRAQILWYCSALERLTGRGCSGIIVSV